MAVYLRFFHLATLTSPYWEEVALAYDSYSLLKTGQDHHGNWWPITAVESFGDYKSSLYFYAAIPFIKIFGLNTLAIRLPSAIAGLTIAIATAFLAINLLNYFFKNKYSSSEKAILFLVTLFLVSISPWAINFSRAAWESNLATALLLVAMNFFFVYQMNNKKYLHLLFGVILFVLSAYTYHANKIIAPMIAVLMFAFYIFKKNKEKSQFRKKEIGTLLLMGVLAFICFWPLIKAGQARFNETSVFSDSKIIEYSNQERLARGNSLWSRIYYHRYLLYTEKIVANFFDHFTFKYLFVSGDGNLRHNSQATGQLYYLDLIFIFLAILFLVKKKKSLLVFLLFALLIDILPSSLTTSTPHSLRTLSAMPNILIIVAIGLWQTMLVLKTKRKEFLFSFFIIIYLLELLNFWKYYLYIYPKISASSWQDAYQDLMFEIKQIDNENRSIYISREQGRPAIYYWFFNQEDPNEVQKENAIAIKDQGEFLNYKNLFFFRSANEIKGSAIVAASPELIKQLNGRKTLLKELVNKNGEKVWQIVDFNYEQ